MKDRLEFQELVAKTLEIAINQNHTIDVEKVQEIFASMQLKESQLNQIYSYLIENKIKIKGIKYSLEEASEDQLQPHKSKEINAKESAYLAQYYEELKLIKEVSVIEETQLLQQMCHGDKNAKQRFIELNLQRIAQIASEYKNQGMTMEDLIQEANIALLQSMDKISEHEDLTKVKEFIDSYVRKNLCDILLEQQDNDDFEKKVIEKGNNIFSSLKELEEIMGEQATIQDLANYMNISEEEIMDTIELLGDALELEPDHNHSHNHEN